MLMTEELKTYNVPQAAKLLNVSERTLWRYVKSGDVPTFKVGRQVRIRHSRLIEWIKAQEDEAEAGDD